VLRSTLHGETGCYLLPEGNVDELSLDPLLHLGGLDLHTPLDKEQLTSDTELSSSYDCGEPFTGIVAIITHLMEHRVAHPSPQELNRRHTKAVVRSSQDRKKSRDELRGVEPFIEDRKICYPKYIDAVLRGVIDNEALHLSEGIKLLGLPA
jgi:hypothetical protein